MNLAQLSETVVPLVDHAAAASDRWLFIGAILIIIVGGTAAIRWLVSSLTAKDIAQANERTESAKLHASERATLIAEIKLEHTECRVARKEDQAAFIAALEKKDTALASLTRAIESLSSSMDRREQPRG